MIYKVIVSKNFKTIAEIDCKSRQEAVDLKTLLNKEIKDYVVLIVKTIK